MDESAATDFDLYADLGDGSPAEEDALLPAQFAHDHSAKRPCASCADLTAQLVAAQVELAQLKNTLAQKETKLTISVRQNGILLRNLSTVFATAQAEIGKLRAATGIIASPSATASTRAPLTTDLAPGMSAVASPSPSATPALPVSDATHPPAKKQRTSDSSAATGQLPFPAPQT